MPLASAIGAGASLLGGILGRNSAKKQQKQQIAFAREEREYNKPINVRARAEEAGFNPLLFVGPGVGNAASGGISGGGVNYMGQAVADAGMLIAEGMRNKSAETKRINDLETQNKELQKKLVQQTIRPPMGGMYQAGGPSIRAAPEPLPLDANGLPVASVPIGGAASDEATAPPRNPLFLWGREFKSSMTSSDAESFEGRYGDFGGSLVGLPLLGQDLYNHVADPHREFKRMSDELDAAVSDFTKRWAEDDRRKARDKNTVKHDEHENRFKGGYRKPRPF